MNDARDPAQTDANLNATWHKTSTGFTHMAGMYKKWQVLGSIIHVTMRPAVDFNLQAGASGTSTYTTRSHIPIKVGLTLVDNDTNTTGEFTAWDAAAMRDDPIKTYVYGNDVQKAVHLTHRYSMAKWNGLRRGETLQTDPGTLTTSPTITTNAILWLQAADKAWSVLNTTWDVSWKVEYRVKFWDFTVQETDMLQGPLPT